MPGELVSIIMPAYNSAETIRMSIRSALSQSYKNIELIIIDDGSTDDTRVICQQQKANDKRIKIVPQDNRGVSAARNSGIRYSNGEFIAFLDADDLWDKDKIELQMKVVAKKPNAVILTGLVRFSGEGHNMKLTTATYPPLYAEKSDYIRKVINLHSNEMACFGTALVRKEQLNRVGLFDESLTTAEDWDLWLRLAFQYYFASLYKPMRYYRKSACSLTRQTMAEKTLKNQIDVIEKAAQCGKVSPSDVKLAKMRKYFEFTNIFLYEGKHNAAFGSAVRGFKVCPEGFGKMMFEKWRVRMKR